MSDSIFSNTPDQGDVVPPSGTPAVQPNLSPEIAELVGEGKKYRTVEAALAALPHSQSHISKLESELAELREEVAKRKAASELLEEFKSSRPNAATTAGEIDPDKIAQLVEHVVSKKEQEKTALSNLKSVVEVFKSTYGAEAEKHYNQLASENGFTVAQFNQLASQSPSMIVKLAGINKPAAPSTFGKVQSDVNTTTMPSNTTTEVTAKVENFSKTSDVVDAWKRAGQIARKNLGIA